VSNLDPPILGSVIPRETGFAAKKELFAVPGLGSLIASLNAIPVDRSRLSIGTLRAFGKLLEEQKSLVFFPEGTRSRGRGLRRPQTGVGMLLTRYPVPIVPAYIEGTDSLFRNVFRRGRVRVIFGRPFTLPREVGEASKRREAYRRRAEAVMDRIRQLKEDSTTLGRKPGLPEEEASARGSNRAPLPPDEPEV
jgi:1-acyl-sn-glycerol-3-phosphate acyltransferase